MLKNNYEGMNVTIPAHMFSELLDANSKIDMIALFP